MEDGQPMYYTGGGMGPGVDSYAAGVRSSQTFADAVFVEFEHGGLDLVGLREFLRGLVDGGPTRSGHRTPAVVVTPPIIGLDATYMRANTWSSCWILAFMACISATPAIRKPSRLLHS